MRSLYIYAALILWATVTRGQVPAEESPLKITSLHIRTDVTYRFATTLISSTVHNSDTESKEVTFDVRLPKNAFISNFSMIIDDKVYLGNIKEKAAAKKQYERAKEKGQSAGHVAKAKPRDTERFKVTVNVAAESQTHFNLTYQELLQRKFGKYEHVIYIDPGEPVPDMRVDVFIVESREIIDLIVPPLRNDLLTEDQPTGSNDLVVIDQLSPKSAHIVFRPSVEEQIVKSAQGLSGQFVVNYDISRQPDAGEILAINGYFVHFFAPNDLKPLTKRLLFVLDTSTSMDGTKLSQLKDAMYTILGDLREGDVFNLMAFDTDVRLWKPGQMVKVSPETIKQAIDFVRGRRARGWTNINKALVDGLRVMAEKGEFGDKNKALMVVFLTDGEPTKGETVASHILRNVKRKNKGGVTIFSLAFGAGADFTMLQKLSAQNDGVARKIYADSDASLQLQGFYKEISTPVLSNMTVKYIGDSVSPESITTTRFPNFFDGTEVVVAGKLNLDNTLTLDLSINGDDSQGDFVVGGSVEVQPSPASPGDLTAFTEKLWAYLTIRQLLDKSLGETNETALNQYKARALELSLKYGFVTPLTSMVVTKPEREELADDAETPDPASGGGDPHFIMNVKGLTKALCFDVKGKHGDIFQLVADTKRDVFVNGEVFAARVQVGGMERNRTYFGRVVLIHHTHRLLITPHKIKLDKKSFMWRENSTYRHKDITLKVLARHNVTIDIRPNISITFVKHVFKKKHIKFLGVAIKNGEGLSPDVRGMMGEFQHKHVTEDTLYNVDGRLWATLGIHRPNGTVHLDVGLGMRNNIEEQEYTACWKVRNSGHNLLDLPAPEGYRVKKLESIIKLK